MTCRVDPPLRIADRLFITICRVERSVHACGSALCGTAQKTPCVVLWLDGPDITVLQLPGCPGSDAAKLLIPEAAKRLREAAETAFRLGH